MKKTNFYHTYIKRLFSRFILPVLLFFLLVGVMTVGAVSPEWTGGTASGFAGGTGAEADPYLISTGEQLAYFSQTVNNGTTYAGKHIKLTQDILLNNMNASGTFVSGNPREFARIGSSPAKSFMGAFDGAGYKITGLYINKTSVSYEGLFGYAETGSVIRNVSISGSVGGGTYSGGVAGYANGLIEGCASSCTVTVTWQSYHGGIAGLAGAGSVIRNCTVSGTVTGTDYVGGIAGRTDGSITGCVASVAVSVEWSNYHGGIAGYAGTGSLISGCAVSGSVTGNECVGGIAGYTAGAITGCSQNTAAISGQSKAGGVAGYASGVSSVISNCTFTGTATGRGGFYVGGLAGQADGTITGCTVSTTVTGTNSYIGGVVGYAAGTGSKITGCTVTVTVNETSGGGYAGGVAGKSEGEISGCIVSVTVTAPNSYIGGVAGYSAGAASKITDCAVSGTVRATAGEGYVGGVAGKTDGDIAECVVSASVSGVHHYVGGVVGYAGSGSEIIKSSSSGAVTGNSEVGGIAGYTDGVLSICINTGSVTGNNGHTGGVAGMAGGSATVSNSFNSGAIDGGSGQGEIGGIVGAVSETTVVHHNLNNGTVEGSQYVGSITGNVLDDDNAWNNYYYSYENAPPGTNTGDIEAGDAAVPVGDLTWEQICALLNTDEDESVDVWTPDLDDDGIPKPETTTPPVQISKSVIKTGKYYTASSLGDETSAAVTSDSIFTVAYNIRYNAGCDLAAQTIRLSENGADIALPANTSVILMADGIYYYVNLVAEAAQSLPLGGFIRMGSETAHYPSAQALTGDQKEYLFIFDFSRTDGIAAGTFKVRLLDADGNASGPMPAISAAGKNTYTLPAEGGANMFTAGISMTPASGYDYKTDGAVFAYEFSLQRDGANQPWPVGTKINGQTVTSGLPYTFAGAAFESTSFNIDMQDCADPPAAGGSYAVLIKAYACAGASAPRSGCLLASGHADITLTAPPACGIRAEAETRIFDSSASEIPVAFSIRTLGPGTVRSTLQYKYGTVYADIAGQTDLPVTMTDARAALTIPAGSAKGTYRFMLVQYDNEGRKRAETADNIIIK